jgi:hypothetical protein
MATMTKTYEEFLANQPTEIVDLLVEARGLLFKYLPGAVESVDNENLGYGFSPGYKGLVLVLTPQKDYINLGIWDGASLADPNGLMEGSGQRHRHIKLRSVQPLENPALIDLIRDAIDRKNKRSDRARSDLGKSYG